ncbi:MAG TPA: type VI secretion system tube protein Hcp [Vicinamibacteria bacterium]|nr:type VI secretion system tube protein Hcp [Vicinamibacteria bacterium]
MAIDVFLKIDGIEGETKDDKHKGEIDLLSFSWGITNPERGRARIEDLRVVKALDLASPSIFDAVCSGDHIKEAQLTIRKSGAKPDDFYKIVMQDVLITSQTPAVDTAGGAIPVEQLALDFDKVEVSYRQQDASGQLGPWVTSSCSPKGRGQ